MNILVYGAGYVGLSIASVLSRDSKLVIVDPDQEKVATINDNKLPFLDSEESLFYQNISNIEAFIDDKGIDFKELDFIFSARILSDITNFASLISSSIYLFEINLPRISLRATDEWFKLLAFGRKQITL